MAPHKVALFSIVYALQMTMIERAWNCSGMVRAYTSNQNDPEWLGSSDYSVLARTRMEWYSILENGSGTLGMVLECL